MILDIPGGWQVALQCVAQVIIAVAAAGIIAATLLSFKRKKQHD